MQPPSELQELAWQDDVGAGQLHPDDDDVLDEHDVLTEPEVVAEATIPEVDSPEEVVEGAVEVVPAGQKWPPGRYATHTPEQHERICCSAWQQSKSVVHAAPSRKQALDDPPPVETVAPVDVEVAPVDDAVMRSWVDEVVDVWVPPELAVVTPTPEVDVDAPMDEPTGPLKQPLAPNGTIATLATASQRAPHMFVTI